MKHFDKELQQLANGGYRSSEDWVSLGRDVDGGAVPRVTTPHGGKEVALFTRDQTAARPKAVRPVREPAVAPVPAAV